MSFSFKNLSTVTELIYFSSFSIFFSEKVNKRLVQGLIREFAAKCREIIIQIP